MQTAKEIEQWQSPAEKRGAMKRAGASAFDFSEALKRRRVVGPAYASGVQHLMVGQSIWRGNSPTSVGDRRIGLGLNAKGPNVKLGPILVPRSPATDWEWRAAELNVCDRSPPAEARGKSGTDPGAKSVAGDWGTLPISRRERQSGCRNGCRLAGHGPAEALALKSGGQVADAAGKKA